jgi:hypothetical protein
MPQSQEFTHLILTRFNTAVGFAPSARGLDQDWLKARLLLFERYCLPSIAVQRGASFTWLVFCDAASPEWFKHKMASFGTLVSTVYIEGPATDEVIAWTVAATGLVSNPYLITTRLDNDDALGKDHLKLIQRAFQWQEREFLLFPFGLQSYRGQLYNVYWKSNPFLSLIERVQEDGTFTTVMCVEHNRVRMAGKVRSIIYAPQWLQVIHGSNLLNTLRGWPRISSRDPSAFSIHWDEARESDTIVAQFRYSVAALAERGKKLGEKLVKALQRIS